MPQLLSVPSYLVEFTEASCFALLLLSLVAVYLVPNTLCSRIASLLVAQKQSSPLAQFDSGIPHLGFTLVGLYLALVLGVIMLIIVGLQSNARVVGHSWSSTVFSSLQDTALAIVGASVAVRGLLSFVVTLVLLISGGNLIGNVPGGYALTTSVVVCGTLSMAVWIWVLILSLTCQGTRFWASLLPQGTPLLLVPLLVPIEALSYLARSLSLGVRLFSNVLSGHTLLAILAGFLMAGLESGWLVSLLSLAFLAVYTSLVFLELAVSLIQAYVFAVLTVSYLEGALH